jgi:hypothetical protein
MYHKCFDNFDTKTRNKLIAMKWVEAELDLEKEIDNLIVPNYWTWNLLSLGTHSVPVILLFLKIIGDKLQQLSLKSDMLADLKNNNVDKFNLFSDCRLEVDDPILIVRNNNGTISIIDGNHRIIGYCQRDKLPTIKVLEGIL